MSVLRPHGRLSFSSLFLAAAKSHPCVSGQKWRFPNVFSNISALQMMNFLLPLCVVLKEPITPGIFFPWVWGRRRNSRLTLVWSSSYLLFPSFHFFYAESIFFSSLHFAVIEGALTVARLHIYIRVQTVNSFFSGEAERSCKNGDHMLTECMI